MLDTSRERIEALPGDAVVLDVAEMRAVRLLGDAGLVPRLRLRRSS